MIAEQPHLTGIVTILSPEERHLLVVYRALDEEQKECAVADMNLSLRCRMLLTEH